jgi:hypothetical protein
MEDNTAHTAHGAEAEEPHGRPPGAPTPMTLPRRRWWAALSAAMLALGVGIGAAIGPAPAASLAGDVPGLAKELPLLIARLAAAHSASTAKPAEAVVSTPPPSAEPAPAATSEATRQSASKQAAPAASSEESAETPSPSSSKTTSGKSRLPAITNVWLIELAGGSLEAATGAQKAAAPYINGTLLAQATVLPAWSAPQASAFASDAVLAESPAAGAPPPLLHSIVQPPCPEASAAACGPETPGQLTAADEFLKAALATITAGPAYREHGLIVITFASVGIASQSELPADASTATLTYQPPAGVALLSPFAKAGQRSSVAFDTTSPRQSLEKLLR